MDDSMKKRSLAIFLGIGKNKKNKKNKMSDMKDDISEDDAEDYGGADDEDMSEDDNYRSYGEDFLSALRSKDPVKLGKVLCEIIEAEKE